MDRLMELQYAAAKPESEMDRSHLRENKMATETKPKPYTQYVRRVAEIKAADAYALSDEALRAKTEDLRKRLIEAKTRKSG